MKHVARVAAAVLVTLAFLFLSDAPYVGIFLAWSVVCLDAMRAGRTSRIKALWFNASFVLFALAAAEGYLYLHTTRKPETWRDEVRDEAGNVTAGTIPAAITDDVLGYAPKRNKTMRWKRHLADELIFDVVVTIDEHGLRRSPPCERATESILFFGGSFTFGPGVNDDETVSYLIGLKYPNRCVYNFAYSGYGPHQMLAALEHGRVEQTIDVPPSHVIYQAIPGHAARAAGLGSWDVHGPKYVRNDQGKAVYRGHFDDDKKPGTAASNRRPKLKPVLWTATMNRFTSSEPDDDTVPLMVAIVVASRDLVARRFPASEFHVILWDEDQPLTEQLVEGLEQEGIRVHRISEILPDYRTDPFQYQLHQRDRHPNRLAHRMIADYVGRVIIGGGADAGAAGVE